MVLPLWHYNRMPVRLILFQPLTVTVNNGITSTVKEIVTKTTKQEHIRKGTCRRVEAQYLIRSWNGKNSIRRGMFCKYLSQGTRGLLRVASAEWTKGAVRVANQIRQFDQRYFFCIVSLFSVAVFHEFQFKDRIVCCAPKRNERTLVEEVSHLTWEARQVG